MNQPVLGRPLKAFVYLGKGASLLKSAFAVFISESQLSIMLVIGWLDYSVFSLSFKIFVLFF